MPVTYRSWGKIGEKDVRLYSLSLGDTRLTVSDYGATVQSWTVRRKDGKTSDLVLGYDSPEKYAESDTYFGATVGPVADRIKNGRCILDGKEVTLPQNAGSDCNHSGPYCFRSFFFDVKTDDNSLCFYKTFCEAERGLPGNLRFSVRFVIPKENVIRIEYSASCDKATVLNITNHSYFTLAEDSISGIEQILTVNSEKYAGTERESDPICDGTTIPVGNTPLDLRNGKSLKDILSRTDCREILLGNGLDQYFFVDGKGLREMAKLESRDRSEAIICRSDMPGIMVYTANWLNCETGKDGRIYKKHEGVCLETEKLPNAVNIPAFRNSVLFEPGKFLSSVTEYEYSAT